MRPSPPAAPAVLCVGETMAQLVPAAGGSLRASTGFELGIAGAESTVALYLADLGHRAVWLSRLGDDPFGERVLDTLQRRGVDTSAVRIDTENPTGFFAKDPGPDGSRVYYYRTGSAASTLSPRDADSIQLGPGDILHSTGITPALSPSAAALLDSLEDQARAVGARFSFDVNHRAGLWSAAEAAGPLLDRARRADIVFVGRDEAERLWGHARAEDIATLFRADTLLVIKDADIGASAFQHGMRTFEPAHRVEVVEPVGAGDAFAAGFLSAQLDGEPLAAALRRGHDIAGWTLGSVHDYRPLVGPGAPVRPPSATATATATATEES